MASFFPGGQDSWTTKVDLVTTILASHVNDLQNAVAALETGGFSTHSIVYAAAITPNIPDGALQVVGILTGNITVNNPSNPLAGRLLILQFTQDGTGGRTVTWGNGFVTSWQPAPAPNAVSLISFWYDGSGWQPLANGPAPSALTDNGGAVFNVKAFGAKGDNSTNDTVALQAAITAAGVKGGIVYFPPGTYLQNAKLNITAAGITLQGVGKTAAILKRTNATNQVQVNVTTANNTTIRDLGFDQGTQTSNWHSVIFADTLSDNCTVRDCSFVNVEGFAVMCTFTAALTRITNLRILDNDVTQRAGGTHDMLVPISQGGTTRGNRISVQGGMAINCYESNDHVVTDNTVSLNDATGVGIAISSSLGCSAVANSINAGGNSDTCFRVMKETDNGFARNQTEALLTGNTTRGSAGVIHYKLNNCSNTHITGNLMDTGYFIQYSSGTIDKVEVSHNRVMNLTAFHSLSVTPTNVIYHDNPGLTGAPASSTLGANVTSVTATGTDERGTIAVVMSGALAANTKIATMTFSTSRCGTAPVILLTNQTSGAGLVIVNPYVLAQSTGLSFDLAADQALAAGTYTFGYLSVG